MHDIEPYGKWQHLYNPEEDEYSPFYGQPHSEFEFSNTVYNYYIHPQWDSFDSHTLYLKILFTDYDLNYTIIEMIGEWNDAVENDVMQLKRSVIDLMIAQGIYKYILIVENVLNFHSSDDSYYEEWNEDIREHGGWIVLLNVPEHAQQELRQAHLYRYLFTIQYNSWRATQPPYLFQIIDNRILHLLS